MRILVIAPRNKSIYNFRGDLIRDMITSGHEVLAIGPGQEDIDVILALGVSEFIRIPFVKDNTSVTGDLKYLLALIKTIREKKPDMVFGYTIKPVIYGSIAARLNKVPHIYAMVPGLGRVYASGGLKVKLIRFITKMLYKCAFIACKRVIFQNPDDIRELTAQKYLPVEKTACVNGSGVNMHRFQRTELPKEIGFLMASRIIKEKGVLEYCQAAREVKKVHPQAKFVLLGGFDNSIGAILPEDIQPYIDDGSIAYLGEVKDPVAYYQQSSVFVLPSYYREGLPRTLLEAMSCGRVIVTTDWPGCREPLEDGVNGYLVPIKDVQALIDRLSALASDRALLERMADAAYETCKNKYEVSIVNRQMRDLMGY